MQCQSTEQINTPIYIGVCRLNDRLSQKCTPILTGLEHARPLARVANETQIQKQTTSAAKAAPRKRRFEIKEYMYTADVYCYSYRSQLQGKDELK